MTTESEGVKEVKVEMRRKKKALQPRLVDSGTSTQEYGPGTIVVIYVRVSTEEQKEGYSLAAQERACREFAERRQWNVATVYADPGHSGKNDKRPGFQSLVAGVYAHQFKIVLIHKLDRFSRNLDNTLKYFRELNEHDVTLASVTEDFDYTTAMGRMFFRMMAVFAQWYLENLSAETIKGKRERAIEGLQNGRTPFGYTKVPGTRIPQWDSAAQRAFRQSVDMYLTGKYTDREIAQYLNDNGFRTFHKRKWNKDAVRVMLQNEFYYGMVSYRNHLYPGQHTPMITKEEFDEMQEIRAKRARRPKSYAQAPKRIYFLHRIASCDKCGRPLRMQSASGHYYYKEMSRERGFECEHSGKSIRTDVADEQVLALLRTLRLPEDWQEEINARLKDADEAQQVEKRRAQLREHMRRLGKAYTTGTLDDEEYERKLKQAQQELETLVVPTVEELVDAGLQIENLGEYLAEANEVERAEISHLLLESVGFDLEQGQATRIKANGPLKFLFALVADEMEWKDDGQGGLKLPKPKKVGARK